jgi:hypothetical protein
MKELEKLLEIIKKTLKDKEFQCKRSDLEEYWEWINKEREKDGSRSNRQYIRRRD